MPKESSVEKSNRVALAKLTAPTWHTAILVALIVGVNVLGVVLMRAHVAIASPSPDSSKIVAAYLPAVAVEWMLFAYAVFVARPRGVLAHLMGREWKARNRAKLDVAWALALIVVIIGAELISARFLDVTQNPAIVTLLPRTVGEHLVWISVAASAGFCEEVVYRGYLQTQLSWLVHSAWAGLALQALLFGIAHAEQGAFVMLRFAIYGLAFGFVARKRASLVPCILAHVSIDLAAGFLPR